MNDTSDMIKININKDGSINTIYTSFVYNYDDTYPNIVVNKKKLTEEDVLGIITKCYENINTNNLARAIKELGKFKLEYVLSKIPDKFEGVFDYVENKNIKNGKYLLVTVLRGIERDLIISLGIFIYCGDNEYIAANFKNV